MLEELYIRDFALITEQRINFSSGLNVITGETGAGKSIILGALGLVLGSKATTHLIRSGAQRSIVQAAFYLSNNKKLNQMSALLSEVGIELEENTIFLKREINIEAKGRSFINAQQVPVGLLRKVGRFLVDIHGQNEHQNIMNVATHRAILDRFADNEELLNNVKQLYMLREDLLQKLTSVSLNEDEKLRRTEILKHEIEEIESAQLSDVREYEDLIAKEKTLANAETIKTDLSQDYSILSESEGNILQGLSRVMQSIEKNTEYDSQLSSLLSNISEAFYTLEDSAGLIRNRRDAINVDPSDLMQTRERLDTLQTLFRKYGENIGDVMTYYEKALNELQGIKLSNEEEARIQSEIKEIESKLIAEAKTLSIKRRETAKLLESKVHEELSFLGMADTRLRVSIKWEYGERGIVAKEEHEKKYIIHPTGLDLVEFLIAASSKEALRPLRKIASGGEMSRLMLALKKIIVDSDPVTTMVFDEVDAGVGGSTAEAVGKRIVDVANSRQVIIITHLHQIAGLSSAKATSHFKVLKSPNEGTRITKLTKEQRLHELARMIGGEEITESAIEHANTLLKN